MAVPSRHPRSTHDASAYQLTLADWEREQAGDGARDHGAGDRRANPEPESAHSGDDVNVAVDGQAREHGSRRSRTRSITGDGFEARQLLTVSEVARATGLSANAIYRAIASGELRASKLRGQLRIQNSDVEAWVDAARVPVRATGRTNGPRCRRRVRRSGPAEACASCCKPRARLQG